MSLQSFDVTAHIYGALAKAPHRLMLVPAFSKTNAGRLEYSCLGISTAVIEFPMRYAHSSVEIAGLKSLAAVSDLLTAYLMTGGAQR